MISWNSTYFLYSVWDSVSLAMLLSLQITAPLFSLPHFQAEPETFSWEREKKAIFSSISLQAPSLGLSHFQSTLSDNAMIFSIFGKLFHYEFYHRSQHFRAGRNLDIFRGHLKRHFI